MWDVDASGNSTLGGGGSGFSDAPGGGASAAASTYAAGMQQMQMMQQQAMQTAVLQQHAAMTRRARRLHVGNLPQGLSIEALKELFNTTMSAAKLTLDESPCVNDVHMAPDARFCFVEFRSAHEASNALVLDGMQASATLPADPPPPPHPRLRSATPPPPLPTPVSYTHLTLPTKA